LIVKLVGNLAKNRGVSLAVAFSSLEFPAIAKSTRADFLAVSDAREVPRELGDAKLMRRDGKREF
jgi:hypothetical protein